MKSVGTVEKSKPSSLTGVLEYTEHAISPGLNLLLTPGNNVESTTRLDTQTGIPICSLTKVSSRTELYKKKKDFIDFDVGFIFKWIESVKSEGEKLIDYIIDVASGRTILAIMRLIKKDFIPRKRGVL